MEKEGPKRAPKYIPSVQFPLEYDGRVAPLVRCLWLLLAWLEILLFAVKI